MRIAGSVRGSVGGRDRAQAHAGARRYRVADLVAELAAREETEQPRPDRPADRLVREAVAVPVPHPAAIPTPPGHAPVAPALAARPRIVEDPSILGLSRHSRSRFGGRLFVCFFVLVYAVIVIQLVVTLLQEA